MTVEQTTTRPNGDEEHPSFGLIGASRVGMGGGSGVSLFDSDIRHRHTVRIQIHQAVRQRHNGHDYIHPRQEIVDIELSEAQWASFVSSMNVGNGVPCTIRWNDGDVPGAPYDPRLRHSVQETHGAAQKAYEAIHEAMAKVEALDVAKAPAKARKEAMWDLRCVINNAVPNVDFASDSLAKRAEDVVQKARADVEAFVVTKARQLGIEPSDIGVAGLLGAGSGES